MEKRVIIITYFSLDVTFSLKQVVHHSGLNHYFLSPTNMFGWFIYICLFVLLQKNNRKTG